MNAEIKVEVQGYQVIQKRVKDAGTTGRIYLPKEWVNKQVKVVLLEPATGECEKDEQR
jgi:putative transposon-encoded protein